MITNMEVIYMTQSKFYLYRFVDKKGNIIYIGRTNDIRRRIIKEHFTSNTHLPNQCYLDTAKVEYTEIINESEEVAYEAVLINQIKPKYNTQFNDNANFDIVLPKMDWKPFKWDFNEQMEIMKSLKQDTVSFSDLANYKIIRLGNNVNKNYIRWGFPDVDISSILSPCTTALITAPAENYKTSFALSIACLNAYSNKKVLYINLKNSFDTIISRILSMNTHIPLSAIQHNMLSDNDWKNIVESFVNLPIQFYNTSMGNDINTIRQTIYNSSYDLVIIDDLNSIKDFENPYDTDKTLQLMKQIKEIALKAQIPIISLYCMNSKEIRKKLSSTTDNRPKLLDLTNTSLISYNDIVQFLYLDTEDKPNSLEIITAKSNIGLIRTAELAFENGKLFSIERSQTEN